MIDLALYRKLFVHRSDVYAVQQKNGAYYPAGRGHWASEDESDHDGRYVYDEYFELDDDALAEHLAGHASYGTYVIEPLGKMITDAGGPQHPNTVKYAVFDLDTFDQHALDFLTREVMALVQRLRPYDEAAGTGGELDCLMLESSGGKGYHIWLFFDRPIEAYRVRAWTEPVRSAYNMRAQDHSGASWPALEIFPKQDAPPEGGGNFGNLVKLPFGVHARTGNRSEIVPVQGWANDVTNVQGLPAELVPTCEQTPVRASVPRQSSGAKLPPFPCVQKIMQEGVGQGNRDNAMFHLALYFADQGVPYEALLTLCMEVNDSFDPPMQVGEIRQKVLSAIRAPHGSCRPDWLRDFCPGGEGCFAPGKRTPKSTKQREPSRPSYWQMSREERRAYRAERSAR